MKGRLLPGVRGVARLEGLFLVGLVVADPRRLDRQSPLRAASLVLIATMSLANAWSAA